MFLATEDPSPGYYLTLELGPSTSTALTLDLINQAFVSKILQESTWTSTRPRSPTRKIWKPNPRPMNVCNGALPDGAVTPDTLKAPMTEYEESGQPYLGLLIRE